MEKVAMAAQVTMTTNMVEVCQDKTLSRKHSSDRLSGHEKLAFQNCVQKYFEAPNHIMSAVNQQMGGGQGGFR